MPEHKIPSQLRRATKSQKLSALGVTAAAGAATLALSLTGTAGTGTDAASSEPAKSVTEPVALSANANIPAQRDGISSQQQTIEERAKKVEAEKKAEAAKKKAAAEKKRKAEAAKKKAAAEKKAKEARAQKAAASRSAKRSATPAQHSYPNNLDGWIRESLAIMKKHGIPGSYDGIHRNIIRESGGDPNAINDWDINAQNGTPSIGLLQVIQPTFDAYHVPGTKKDLRDPVANIVAACNYAADRYGSMDNVFGAY